MNYAELQHVTRHLNFALNQAVIEQISDGNCKLQLGFHRHSETSDNHRYFIILDFRASHLDIYPTRYPKRAPAVPQAFTMLLRKYLMGLHVLSVRLATDDRIVFIEFGQNDDIQFSIIAELTGCNPRIFLVDAETQQILGLIGEDENRTIHGEYTRPEPCLNKTGTDKYASMHGIEYELRLDADYTSRDETEAFRDAYLTQTKRLKHAISRTSRLIDSLNADLDKVEAARHEKIEADILNAYAWQINKGTVSVDLPDFETGALVHILLDPALSVRGNIDKMYNHSKRMLKAQSQIESRLLKAMQRLDDLNQLYSRVQPLTRLDDIRKVEPEIDKLCLPDEKKRPDTNRRPTSQVKAAVHQPFKTFTSVDGISILVGKSASDNDDLTFHHARGNDTWLHVCQVPGSHVIVKHPNPSQETLLDAALLALHYSKIAQSSNAEIHVTQVKYVRKPKGAPAGKVEIRGEKSIHIRRDEKRLARILATQN